MVTIVVPFVANYRAAFYEQLAKRMDYDIITVQQPKRSESFKVEDSFVNVILNSYSCRKLTVFNPFSKALRRSSTIVFSFDPKWLTIYFFIFTKWYHKKKIYLWTHGVSVEHGFNPYSLRDRVKLFIFGLADGIIFYTENEKNLFREFLPNSRLSYLNNTLDITKIIEGKCAVESKYSKARLKQKHQIDTKFCVIFCARFILGRRVDLLMELITRMSKDDVTFIVIGGGAAKPDFDAFENVLDFGVIYDYELKSELFSMADFCFQPAWTGLSIIESFANGVPYITFNKSNEVNQCVEFSYLHDKKNGFVVDNISEARTKILNTPLDVRCQMQAYCLELVEQHLTMENMVNNFVTSLH